MKVLFIQPFGNESNTNYPPLGLLYLAAYLRSNMECSVRVLDLRLNRKPIEEKLSEIEDWAPDIVAITGMSIEWSSIRHIIHAVRERLGKRCKIVAGGPHATAFAGVVLEQTSTDFVIKGEGEVTFLHLAIAIAAGGDTASIAGLAYKASGGEIIETDQRGFIEDLDSVPFPAYDLLDIEEYFIDPHFHNNLNKHNRILPILTARGCPFKCSFCYHLLGFKFRSRSSGNILSEIEQLVERYNVKEFHVEDDIFNFDMDRARDVMRRVEHLGKRLSFAFPNGLKIELIDAEMVAQFKRAGVYRINLGIESAVQRVQNIVAKPVNLGKVDQVIAWLNDSNISSHGFFMIGFPEETESEIMQTIDYAASSKLATANFSLVKVFPMTPLGDKYLSDVTFSDDHSFSYDSVATNMSSVSDEKLKSLEKLAYIKFYFRPSRVWRIFRTSPNKKNLFFRNIFTVLSLVFTGKAKY